MTPTQRRQRRRLLLVLFLPSLICLAVAALSLWKSGDDDFSWAGFLSGAIVAILAVGVLVRYVLHPRQREALAAAQRARQDAATLDALEPLGPTHDGGQR
jgi:predicted permease